MLKRRIEPRGDEIEVFVPEDQAERDLLAGIVNHHIPERYNVMAVERTVKIVDLLGSGPDDPPVKCLDPWPEYVAFGLMLTEARMSGTYEGDAIGIRGLMGLYFRAYVTTDPEKRILIDLVIEDNDEKHLEAICEIVNKKQASHQKGDPLEMPFIKPGFEWTPTEAVIRSEEFMWCVNCSLDQDPHKRTEWVQI